MNLLFPKRNEWAFVPSISGRVDGVARQNAKVKKWMGGRRRLLIVFGSHNDDDDDGF